MAKEKKRQRHTRIFVDSEIKEGEALNVDEATRHHLINVLRFSEGDAVIVFNGRGGEYNTYISGASTKKQLVLDVKSFSDINRESPLKLIAGLCLSRSDRIDWSLQKATELGVSEFKIIRSEFSNVSYKTEKLKKKMQHWRSVVISACEQSGRTAIPMLTFFESVDGYLASVHAQQCLVLHHRSFSKIRDIEELSKKKSVEYLIGPEGGLSAQEIDQAAGNGFTEITLGTRVLRTETAPVVVSALLQNIAGDF